MAEEKKFIGENALTYLKTLLKNKFATKVDKEFKTGSSSDYKVLSDNNLTDELVTKINNAGDSSFSGNYNDLTNKPDLSVYATTQNMNSAISTATTDMATKTYVTQQLANINKKQIVTSTTEMTDAKIVYLMANSGSGNNIYDEYLVIDGTPEKVGTTEVDLANYVQEDDLVEISNGEIDTIFADF